MVTDEQRAAVGELAGRALDAIETEYGDEATLGDAILVYEVLRPGDEDYTVMHTEATTERATVVLGMLELATDWVRS